jgi:hypothetical protein
MYVIRDIMHCKPGRVRPLVEKFLALSKLSKSLGMSAFRVMTDVSADRFWTVVAELEMPSLDAFEKMNSGEGMSEKDAKEFEKIMQGYHDLVDEGRREIYKLAG